MISKSGDHFEAFSRIIELLELLLNKDVYYNVDRNQLIATLRPKWPV